MSYSFVIPWTVACQTPLSMGFLRQEDWSGLPFYSPKIGLAGVRFIVYLNQDLIREILIMLDNSVEGI